MPTTNPAVDRDPLMLAAQVLSRFRDVPADKISHAIARADGGVDGLTYGDLRALVADLINVRDRLARISGWHARESGPGGTVGDFCVECGVTWPCDTRRMADGTYVDEDPT